MKLSIKKNRLFLLPIYFIISALFIVLGRKYLGTANIAIGIAYLTALPAYLCTDCTIVKDKYKELILYVIAGLCILSWIPLTLSSNVAYDPGYTVAMVRHSLKEIVELCSYDVHSPLYYFIAYIFYHVFNESIFGLKICSLVFMGFYFLLLLFPFKKLFGRRVTLYALLVSATLPTLMSHAAEPRMYSMAFVSYSLLCLLAYRLMKKFKWLDAIFFSLTTIFCIYIHTYTMIAAVILYLVMAGHIICGKHEDKKKMLIFFPINALAVSVSYVPWLFVLVRQFAEKGKYGGELQKPSELIWEIVTEQFSSVFNPQTWQSVLGLGIFIAMFVIVIVKKESHIKEMIIYFAVFFMTSVLGVFLASTNSPCFMGRYVTCASFSIIMITAIGLSLISNRKIAGIIILSFMFSGLVVYKNELKIQYDTAGIKAYNEYIDANVGEEDAIMYSEIHTDMLTIFHPDVYSLIYAHEDKFNPFNNDEVFNKLSQLDKVEGDVYYVCFADRTPEWYLDCEFEHIMTFHYMYYNISLYKIWNWK